MRLALFILSLMVILSACKKEEELIIQKDTLEFKVTLEKDPSRAGKIWIKNFSYTSEEPISNGKRLVLSTSDNQKYFIRVSVLEKDTFIILKGDGVYQFNASIEGHRFQYDTVIQIKEFPDFMKIKQVEFSENPFLDDDRVNIQIYTYLGYNYVDVIAPISQMKKYTFKNPVHLEVEYPKLYKSQSEIEDFYPSVYTIKFMGQQRFGSSYYNNTVINPDFDLQKLYELYPDPKFLPTKIKFIQGYTNYPNLEVYLIVEWVNNQ